MILVTGGAGYIGSHANKELTLAGYETVVLDNMSYGHEDFLKWGVYENVDLGDLDSLRKVFQKYKIEAVMHFAAFTYVGESVEDPQKYYLNNLKNTLNLLQVMNEFKIKKIIFSSTPTAKTFLSGFSTFSENGFTKPIKAIITIKIIKTGILFFIII